MLHAKTPAPRALVPSRPAPATPLRSAAPVACPARAVLAAPESVIVVVAVLRVSAPFWAASTSWALAALRHASEAASAPPPAAGAPRRRRETGLTAPRRPRQSRACA